jgi:cellobiose dehydrogenase (acceptor)
MKKIISCLLLCIYVAAIEYDVIIVGAGTASSIVATRLVEEFPNKQILILEAGAPTSKRVGGTDYPPYAQQNACYVDIPGEYGSMAWGALTNNYKLKEAGFTWQGMGYGGNSQFNGMLFQSAPVSNMDNWPTGWKSSDLLPYYDRIISKTHITPAPSTDSSNYNTGIADAIRNAFNQCGLTEEDTRILNADLGAAPVGYFSRPYVVTDGNGQRGGIVDVYLSKIINSQGVSSKSNLKIIPLAKVSKILFDNTGTATGVQYYLRSNKQDVGSDAPQGELRTVNIKSGGRVILGAGALMNPRLLYQSGVGPKGQEAQRGQNLNFVINNPAIGSTFTDHIGIQIGVKLKGGKNYKYADYGHNTADTNRYMQSRSGPYSQFGPVLFAHLKSSSNTVHPDIEVLVSASSNYGSNPTYYADDVFQIMLVHMNQRAKTQLTLNGNGFVNHPNVFYDGQDVDELTNALYYFLNTVLPKNQNLKVVFGPGGSSHPNLNPSNKADVRSFIANGSILDGIAYSGMIMNHFTGTVPLESNANLGGVDPNTLIVRGTTNVHVVDASLYKPPVAAHPVATVMAGAEKAADLLVAQMQSTSVPNNNPITGPAPSGTSPAPSSSDSTSAPGSSDTSTPSFSASTGAPSGYSNTTPKPNASGSPSASVPTRPQSRDNVIDDNGASQAVHVVSFVLTAVFALAF